MATLREQAITLLPPNRTQLEIDYIETCLEQIQTLKDSNASIKEIKSLKSPDNVIPWLIYEYQLGKLAPFIKDKKQLIDEGLKWKREQGTLASVKRALRWIDREDELLEDHDTKWWHFTNNEIRLFKEIPNLETIANIVKLVKLSLPKRSTLARVWSGDDLPMFTLNESQLNNCRFNVPGGYYDEDLDVWLYINNKLDTVVESGNSTLVYTGEEVEDYTIVTTFPKLNSANFLNSIRGRLCSVTMPEFSSDHTTVESGNMLFSGLLRLDDETNLADITSHVYTTELSE